MNPSESQSPLSEEQIRQRREEAARRQALQLRQQTQRIQEQRMRPVRPEKKGPTPGAPAAASPAGVSAPLPTVAPMPAPAAKAAAPVPVPPKGPKPSGIKVSGWVNAEKIAAELAAEQAAMAARAQTSATRKATSSVPAPPSSSTPEQPSAVAAPSPTTPPAKAAPVVLKMTAVTVDLPPEAAGAPAPPMADAPPLAAAPSSIDDDEIRARRLAAELSAPASPPTMAAAPPPVGEHMPVLRMSTKPVALPKPSANPGDELNAFQVKVSPVEKADPAAELPPPLPPPLTRSTTAIPMVRALGAPAIPGEVLHPPPPPPTIALTGQKAPTVRIDNMDLDLAELPDVICPKCHVVIPESHHGSFVAQCANCGEIIKLK